MEKQQLNQQKLRARDRVLDIKNRAGCTTRLARSEGYDTGLLGVRDFRISVISN